MEQDRFANKNDKYDEPEAAFPDGTYKRLPDEVYSSGEGHSPA